MYSVFLTHGKADGYVARNLLVPRIKEIGATVFIDDLRIDFGDDFRDAIFQELRVTNELLAFLTPTSIKRPWIFTEIGAVSVRTDARIVPLLYGITVSDLEQQGALSVFGSKNIPSLDDFDDYLLELSGRIAASST